MSKTVRLVGFGIIMLVIFALGLAVVQEDQRRLKIVPAIVQPTDYGNGVYLLFISTGSYSEYARSLAAFKEAHPELRCNTEQLSTFSHLLNCYDIAISAQNVVEE